MSEPTALAEEPRCAVLYLDDEEPLVFLVSRLLRHLGFEPFGFTAADDALQAFRSDPAKYALVLTDLSMPGASGLDFAQEVLTSSPDARVAILTGHASEMDVTRATALGVRAVVRKPMTVDELGPVVRELLR